MSAAALLCAACSEEPADVPAAEVDSRPPASLMTPLDFAAWEQVRRDYAPDIVVVDLWAGWCVPCLERFPKMIELHDRYAGQNVQFVSLSLDDRDSPGDLEFAEAFLARQKAPFPHYLLDEPMLDGFEKIGIQGVPAVDVFGRDGELYVRLTGADPNNQFGDEDVESAIVQLLEDRAN